MCFEFILERRNLVEWILWSFLNFLLDSKWLVRATPLDNVHQFFVGGNETWVAYFSVNLFIYGEVKWNSKNSKRKKLEIFNFVW